MVDGGSWKCPMWSADHVVAGPAQQLQRLVCPANGDQHDVAVEAGYLRPAELARRLAEGELDSATITATKPRHSVRR